MKYALTTALIALTLGFSPAFADDHGHKDDYKEKAEQRFAQTDKDGDGKISKDEMLEMHRQKIDERFKNVDTDGDGYLSKEELKAGREKFREKMKDRMENRRDRWDERDKKGE